MGLSLYEITVPPYIHGLKNLRNILKKGEAHFAGKEAELFNANLIADMGGLPFQVQQVSNHARKAAVLVGHAKPVVTEDNEKSFADLYDGIQKTINLLEKLDPHSMDGKEDEEITVGWGPKEKVFTGKSYVLGFSIPNFYFHLTTAYAILRKDGVPVGKLDFLGAI